MTTIAIEEKEKTEVALIELLKKVREVYKMYNPDGDYLTISINDDHISLNNTYWADDFDRQLSAYLMDGEITHCLCDEREVDD